MRWILLAVGVIYGVSGAWTLAWGIVHYDTYAIIVSIAQLAISLVIIWAFATVSQQRNRIHTLEK